MAIRAIKKKINTQTEQKVKGGRNKMLHRNIFGQPIENEWRIELVLIFFRSNSTNVFKEGSTSYKGEF